MWRKKVTCPRSYAKWQSQAQSQAGCHFPMRSTSGDIIHGPWPWPQSILREGPHFLKGLGALFGTDLGIKPTSLMVLKKHQIMTTMKNNKEEPGVFVCDQREAEQWETWTQSPQNSSWAQSTLELLCSHISCTWCGCGQGLSLYRGNTWLPHNTS